jgi:predicted acylesterase/phospholipase RssA
MVTTALVLSAGGMFGAYQAGAWKALAPVFTPDLVVGASAGSLNGWAIAGGCSPQDLMDLWLDPAMEKMMRVRWRWSSWQGLWDPAPLEAATRALCEKYRPRIPYALTLTQVPWMRARVVRGEDVTWRHLAASCSVPTGFPPVAIDGKLYVDGGVLAVLPLFAAAEWGADRAIAVNALPLMPSWMIRNAARLAYRIGPGVPASHQMETLLVRRPAPLGKLSEAIHWSAANIRRWIEFGEEDAAPLAERLASERAIPLK